MYSVYFTHQSTERFLINILMKRLGRDHLKGRVYSEHRAPTPVVILTKTPHR